ncbi:MAG: HD domain-containing protein [Candidatus Paceibacterota bacterium]|jgi:predicted metal-dependent HD superfamily phosphohydrolase
METIHTAEASSLEKGNAAFRVINFALAEVEQKYGTGMGDGENPKFYHNLEHTKNVLESARKMAELALKNGNIKIGEDILLAIVAAGHDIEQDLGSGANERESSRVIQEEMKRTRVFSEEEISKVDATLLATIFFLDGALVKQSVTDDYMTKIMADADLCALGQPTEYYWKTAQDLLHEIKGTETPSLEDQLAWAHRQVSLLSGHQYYTEEAKELFPHIEENLVFAKEQVKRLEKEMN